MELKKGKTYELQKDVLNPKPDRRVRNDWRALTVWERGMRFNVGEDGAVTHGRYTSNYVRQDSDVVQQLRPHLKEVYDTRVILKQIYDDTYVDEAEILRHLMDTKIVSEEQVRQAAKMIDEAREEDGRG